MPPHQAVKYPIVAQNKSEKSARANTARLINREQLQIDQGGQKVLGFSNGGQTLALRGTDLFEVLSEDQGR